jgi:hypothetical protein
MELCRDTLQMLTLVTSTSEVVGMILSGNFSNRLIACPEIYLLSSTLHFSSFILFRLIFALVLVRLDTNGHSLSSFLG